MRAYCAAKYESFVRDAALADSMRAMRSHLEPLRVFPEKCLPADSLFPGHIPVHDANRPAEPKRLMSTPISEMITSADRRLTPGMVSRWSIGRVKGIIILAISLLSRSMDSSIYSRCASTSPTSSRWVGENQPTSALRNGIFL